jgi:hypothetical protein
MCPATEVIVNKQFLWGGAWGNGVTAVTPERVAKLRPVTDPSSDRVIVLKMR